MIQRITKNTDIKFCVSDDAKIQDKFIIKFYTIDRSKAITRTADNVILDNGKRYIKLNWSTLKLLENGMLNYEVNNLDSDADYNDGVYNSTFTCTTYYYIYTDSNGIDAVEQIEQKVEQIEQKVDKVAIELDTEEKIRSHQDILLQIKDKDIISNLDSEIDRAKTAEAENTEKIGNEVTNRKSADQYIRNLLKTETSERKAADSTLTDTITNLDTRLKILENKETSDFGTY